MSIYVGDKEIKNLYIGESTSISDMQGPAPDGFHVPLSTEWQAIYDALGIILSHSIDGTEFATYLKIPIAGARDNYTTVHDDLGVYWSSSPVEDDYNTARLLYFDTSDVEPQTEDLRSFGLALRCVKNSPTIPTASWEVIYQGSGSAGIFHNPTDGLISLSSDGITWYTLMDKNLGATTVYNYGDTLTDANCGNVFQRGNNYAFPGTLSSDSIDSDPENVDASNYGPGNYYNSSTWITDNPRDYSDNGNLRGGITQGTTEIGAAKEVYLGDTKVWENGPSLLTYEEIIALTQTEALTELNSNVEAYYNKLNSENHIVTGGSFSVYVLGMIDPIGDTRGYDYTTKSYPTQKQKGISYHFIKWDSSNSTFVDYNR